jgi:hypothetical protein
VCNDETAWPGGEFATNNPFTPDILVFNQNGKLIRGPLGKPTSSGGGFQPRDQQSTSRSSAAFPAGCCSRPTPINRPISTTARTIARGSAL